MRLVPVLMLLAAAALAAPCEDPAHRQFDFWLGEWEVRTPDGTLAGTNAVAREYGGCVIHERYDTGRGYGGESLNAYDAARGVWHQTWMDSAGTVLLLEGGLVDGSMVLEGDGVGPGGGPVRHRITWTPHPDGSVRQHWESSGADGAWTTVFDGLYTKAER